MKKGFTLLEVLVSIAIAVLMLSVLISLETKSTALAARAIMGFDTLPIAIDRIEELSKREFTGVETEKKGDYEIRTTAGETSIGIPVTRIKVEVLFNGESYSELAVYKFKF